MAKAVARYDNPKIHLTKDKSVLVRLPISNDLVTYLASADYDPRNALSMSAAERDGRRQSLHYLEILKTIKGCENAYLVSTGPEFGTRESRHIQTNHTFTWQDVAEGTQFDDCIAFGAWGAEWHDRQDYSSSFDLPPRASPIKSQCPA